MSIADAQNICTNPTSKAKHHLLLRVEVHLTAMFAISSAECYRLAYGLCSAAAMPLRQEPIGEISFLSLLKMFNVQFTNDI